MSVPEGIGAHPLFFVLTLGPTDPTSHLLPEAEASMVPPAAPAGAVTGAGDGAHLDNRRRTKTSRPAGRVSIGGAGMCCQALYSCS